MNRLPRLGAFSAVSPSQTLFICFFPPAARESPVSRVTRIRRPLAALRGTDPWCPLKPPRLPEG